MQSQDHTSVPKSAVPSESEPELFKPQEVESVARDENRVSEISVTAQYTSGPLPPSHEMAAYEGILSGSADRIIKMAEKSQRFEQVYRIGLMFCSFSIVMSGFVLAGFLIYKDKGMTGFSLVVGELVALVVAFKYGRPSKASSNRKK